MTETFYIDNHAGVIELYRYDSREAWGKYSVPAKFLEMLMPTIDQLKRGESLTITVKKDDQ